MVKAGVHQNKARQVWSQGFQGVRNKPKEQQDFEDYVYEKLDLLQVEVAKGRVDDKAAWLIVAIRDNYAHSDYQKRKQSGVIRKKIAELETKTKRIECEQRDREFEILQPLLADNDNLEKAFEECKHSPLANESWREYTGNLKKAVEEDSFFGAFIKLSIKEQHAEKFSELNDYQKQIQQTEIEINTLRARLRR